jgi:hypothetical protein
MRTAAPPSVRPLVLVALIGALLTGADVASPATACASTHSDTVLSNFAGGNAAPHFYLNTEGQPVHPRFLITIHGCTSQEPVRMNWDTVPDTATAGDFVDSQGPSDNINTGPCPSDQDCFESHTVNVQLQNDALAEPVSERLRFVASTSSGRLYEPRTVPIHIVDLDGTPNRVGFAQPLPALPYEQFEFERTARIPVLRAGPTTSAMTVNFALAGTGTEPAESSDFSPANGQVAFGSGQRLAWLTFSIANDADGQPETISARLTSASSGSVDPTQDQVNFRIRDAASDNRPPESRFHHPRHRLKYAYNDYRIREMHTFFKSDPSGVKRAWLALRLQRIGGRCAWYNGSRFVPGRCGAKRWLAMKFFRQANLFAYRVEALQPSIGTKIRNYRAWTRTQDGAGNMERTFQRGRNLSTFEVRRR